MVKGIYISPFAWMWTLKILACFSRVSSEDSSFSSRSRHYVLVKMEQHAPCFLISLFRVSLQFELDYLQMIEKKNTKSKSGIIRATAIGQSLILWQICSSARESEKRINALSRKASPTRLLHNVLELMTSYILDWLSLPRFFALLTNQCGPNGFAILNARTLGIHSLINWANRPISCHFNLLWAGMHSWNFTNAIIVSICP